LTYISNPSGLPAEASILSPGRKKKSLRVTTQRSEDREDYVIEHQLFLNNNHHSKTSIANINERNMSSESVLFDSNDMLENSGFMSKGIISYRHIRKNLIVKYTKKSMFFKEPRIL
jgi:hypothetical protein